MFEDEEDLYFDALLADNEEEDDLAMANQLTIKTSVDLPVYSGHPVSTKYTGKDGTSTELYRVQDWLFEIQKIGKAGNWSAETMATQAAMKLVPGSPAANWIKVVEQSGNEDLIDEISTWDTFSSAMIREFGAPADFGSLVALLHSFKQEQNELVRDFYHRLVLGYNEFRLSLPDSFRGAPFDGESEEQKKRRGEVVAVVSDFHLKAFFVAGLKPDIRKEVIKSGPDSVAEILQLAKRIEQARMQEKKSNPPAGSQVSSSALNAAVNARLAELGYGPAPASVAATGAKSKDGGSSRKKERPGEIVCFYCGAQHLASKCERRTSDRGRGIWRPTVRDQEMSRAQWEALSKDERAKGAKIFGKASSVAPPASGQQPSSAGSSVAASVIPGMTYSSATSSPLESAWSSYRRQGN